MWEKVGVAILISDIADFRVKKVIRVKRALHNDKMVNPPRRYNA